jgi:HTH-type transcriptional regulator / antitoxin HigA
MILGYTAMERWRTTARDENIMSNQQTPIPSPGHYILEELKRRGWTQEDLSRILNRSVTRVNELVRGKQAISPEIALDLQTALGDTAEEWLRREAVYRLSLTTANTSEVGRRAKLFELAPIKEIQKRGWIRQTDDVGELEEELKRFFDDDLQNEPKIVADFRKSSSYDELTPAQRAWCARAMQLARSLPVSEFRESKIPELKDKLRKLAAFPQEAKKVAAVLASYGIRFLVIEPLQGSKIDGAAMWLDQRSPIIALSLRYDRIDNFWHNIGHELSHIDHKDAISIDVDLTDERDTEATELPPVEQRANAEASVMLFPSDALHSFILRVAPIYSKERINQFANRVKIHPGIIVGQLQRRKEIGYSANREMLVKIRGFVISTAVTTLLADPHRFRVVKRL